MSITTSIALWTIAVTVVLPMLAVVARYLTLRAPSILDRAELTEVHSAERLYADAKATLDADEARCLSAACGVWGAAEAIKATFDRRRSALVAPVKHSTTAAEAAFFGPMLRDKGRYVSRYMSDYQGAIVDRRAATTDSSVHVSIPGSVYELCLEKLPAHGFASDALWLVESSPMVTSDVLDALGEHEAATDDPSVTVEVGPSLYRDLLGQWGLYQWSADNYRQHQDVLGACVASAEDGAGRVLAVS